MDHQLEISKNLTPIERRPRQDWPWCKGFIVKGVLYSSQAPGREYEDSREFVDMSRTSPRSRATPA